MKRIIFLSSAALITVMLIISNGCKHSTEPDEVPIVVDTTGGFVERKPNIYLYPVEPCIVTVKIEFPLGGDIIESEPAYDNGWTVNVDPSGKINQEYDYLFYESSTPEVYQSQAGWIISKDSLKEFFSDNLSKSGFNDNEKSDFLEYWVPRLVDYDYYIIYPQYSPEIERIIKLNFSVKPDNVIRLFYVIKGTVNNKLNLLTPVIPQFKREGFVAAEWGVVLK